MPGPSSSVGMVTRVLADPVRMYLPSPYWNRARDFFSFNLDYNTLGASGNTSDQFSVQNDSDFLVLSITASAATAAAGTAERAYLPYLISIQDTGSGAQWFGGDGAGFTHIQNVVTRLSTGGSQGVDYAPLEHPRFVPAASTVTVVINNLSANTDRLWLSFRGVKIYRSLRQGQ